MKEIKKLLSSQAKEILPDEKIKNSITADIYGTEKQKVYAGGGIEKKHINKAIYAIIAATFTIIIVLCVTFSLIFKGNSTPSVGITTLSTDDFYAYGAASAGSILSARNTESTTASATVSKSATTASAVNKTATSESLTDGQQQAVDLVNEYIYYVEELLGNNSVTYSTAAASGDLSGEYQYAMTISYCDLLGGGVSYTMYYNEYETGTKTEKDEVETNYQISGILVVDGEEYTVTGGRSTETETDESSEEIWFKAYTDSNSYILIKQEYEVETEGNETETETTTEIYIYTDGKLTESVVAEMESEDGESELELEITKDGIKSTLEFSYQTKNGQTVINVDAKIGNTKYTFKIYVESDSYRYVFGSTQYSEKRN